VRQRRDCVERTELAVVEQRDAGAGPDPEALLRIQEQHRYLLVGNRRLVLAIEHGEAHTVETRQAFLGTDPQIAVRRTRQRLCRGLRQPLGDLPVIENVLTRGERRVESKRMCAECDEQRHTQAAHLRRFDAHSFCRYRVKGPTSLDITDDQAKK
jgi:hypothetical protein